LHRKLLTGVEKPFQLAIKEALNNSVLSHSITFLEADSFSGSSFENLVDIGFSAKNKKETAWTKEEHNILMKALQDIHSEKVVTQVKDTAYYISHYVFHGTKSKAEVEQKINQQIRTLLQK
jgi:hypothetical protein